MGWDRLVGTGVATALKIVQWPTPFLTRHSASSVGRGYSNEQSPPRSRAYRRVHTDRSDPTILQYSDLRRYSKLTASQQKPGVKETRQGATLPKQVSGNLEWDNMLMHWRVPELHPPIKDLVCGKIKDATSPSQPVSA